GARVPARSLRPAANAGPPRKYVRPRSARSSAQPAPGRGRCRRSRCRARTDRAGRAAAPTACVARRVSPAAAQLLLPRVAVTLMKHSRQTRSAPSPLVGEGWGGGSLFLSERRAATLTPTPSPSPQGGGEHHRVLGASVLRQHSCAPVRAQPRASLPQAAWR